MNVYSASSGRFDAPQQFVGPAPVVQAGEFYVGDLNPHTGGLANGYSFVYGLEDVIRFVPDMGCVSGAPLFQNSS